MNDTVTNDESAFAKAKKSPPQHKACVAFYNLENLFDTHDDPEKLDEDFTPRGEYNWTDKRLKNKLRKLSTVISKIGATETGEAPSLLGVAEVETTEVLEQLVATKTLQEYNYGVVHYESPDERGIDVGLLYRKAHFEVLESEAINVYVETEPGVQDYTRDILHVHGKLLGMPVHVLVNHWPSRRQGAEETAHKRIAVAQRCREIIAQIKDKNPDARIIIMGDFNDDPHSEAVKNHLVQSDFYNPMVFLLTRYEGSLNHRFEWYLFDQLILSTNFMQLHHNPFRYDASKIYNDVSLTEFKGKFKGNPFRTYAGKRYLGGYSDHFPVYTIFDINPMKTN
ncbi:endonuclease [Dokdonia sinensis]|uniref:endonuclease/exonuclease/phosphatase family protein n=1 Tax=Dokdonia sinensis TaxID=2479847 RepID=UPI001F1B6F09|nr:endonuclease [Dokdonia sinensis]